MTATLHNLCLKGLQKRRSIQLLCQRTTRESRARWFAKLSLAEGLEIAQKLFFTITSTVFIPINMVPWHAAGIQIEQSGYIILSNEL